ncbi:MAG: FapA family protein, partial [Synergistaceae bacterium]|nr:FapA family protein [Synergistaceae bacterium]
MAIDKFRMEVREDGIYLAAQEDAEFSVPSIVGFLKSKGVENFNAAAISSLAHERLTSPVKVAERDPALEKDAEFDVRVSSDGLLAELWIEPPFADKPWPTLDQALSFLQEKGVVEGIDREVIASMLSEKNARTWVPVANGVSPVDGEDAEIEYMVEFGSAKPKEEDEQGRVDLKNLSSVTVILKDQLLATKIPPTEGAPGVTVKGVPLKAKNGKDRPLPAGAGTYAWEDGLSLHSMIDGNLVLKGNKLNVVPVFQVDGDVDYSVGNID